MKPRQQISREENASHLLGNCAMRKGRPMGRALAQGSRGPDSTFKSAFGTSCVSLSHSTVWASAISFVKIKIEEAGLQESS